MAEVMTSESILEMNDDQIAEFETNRSLEAGFDLPKGGEVIGVLAAGFIVAISLAATLGASVYALKNRNR